MRLAAAGGDSAAIFGVNLGSNTVRLTAIHNPRGHCLPPCSTRRISILVFFPR